MEILCMEILCIPFRAQKILFCAQEILCMGDFVHGNFVHPLLCTKILFCAQEITCTGDFVHGNFVHGKFLTQIRFQTLELINVMYVFQNPKIKLNRTKKTKIRFG